MFGYDLAFFVMELVPCRTQSSEASESDPILCRSTFKDSSEESESSSEIRTVDDGDCENLEADEISSLVFTEQQCRICLETGGEDLIAPCHCKGTQKYVHRSCLDNWRSTKEGFAFSHCTECRAVFILRANVPPDRWWLRIKFQLLVLRDHTLIFVIVQLVVAFLGMLVYRFYGDELREMFGYEEHPYGFYTLATLAVILVGLLYGFFIAIICGQRINERHYHVLAKQELTKEYVVQNRDEDKDPPELDPGDLMELRIMGLY
ncbi:E3 ubiquitin-protein ligase MARCH1 isoform X2 [Phalaenopsis equestris]|uniref:E3 ubiquitin-protein ligase MARCH1 isoform X2 n=1 Tax=Phalaenopsis equestris TaxID=78828 RepID=UPI0009E3AE14|nr:E3 ubiquitin-protein ligase MARCH1 isoform X2 [Phalaenopsis equestris]